MSAPARTTPGAALDAALTALVPAIAEQVAALLAERTTDARSPWLTVAEAAEHLRCRPKRIYDLISQSRLPAHRDGSRVLLRRDQLDAYLSGEPVLADPQTHGGPQ
jgi:excisionase family DNA binding protein